MKSLRSLIRKFALIQMSGLPPSLFYLDLYRKRRLVVSLCGWPAVKVGRDAGRESADADRGVECCRRKDVGIRSWENDLFWIHLIPEFCRLTQAFNSVMDRFQRNGQIQRSFCDIAAHEMKTPLTILQGNLEVALLKARTTEEYREALINNLEQVGRLIALTRSLLTLATFTSGKPPLHLMPLSLGPMIQDLVDELTLLASDRRITLSFESQSVPPVFGDAQCSRKL
jgi:signal transduction histidine kinase